MIAPVFSQGTRARTCSLKTEAWSVGTSMQNQLCRHLRCTHRHCFSMVTRLRSFQNQTCNSSYNGQSAPQHCWRILNLGAFISCWCVVQQEKENISAATDCESLCHAYLSRKKEVDTHVQSLLQVCSNNTIRVDFASQTALQKNLFPKNYKELRKNRERQGSHKASLS